MKEQVLNIQQQLVEMQKALAENGVSVAMNVNFEGGEVNLTADQEQALGAMLVEQSDLMERLKTFLHS